MHPTVKRSAGRRHGRRPDLVVAAALALATAAAFAGLARNGFVPYDDPSYVTANPWVGGGLTAAGVRWALTTTTAANWHPLTWLSHMLDVELFGLDPRGHHLAGLALHAASSLLLFALLRGLTGARWRPALVAALFALHPLHVQSVAWASERKDLLSTLLALAAALAYLRAARRGAVPRSAAAPLLFALALLAKPMPVTLPLLLLLLDWWPLGRWSPAPGAPPGAAAPRLRLLPPPRLWLEKAPLFLLAAAAAAATLVAQRGAMVPPEVLSTGARIANALLSYLRYLGKALWPADLAVLYPLPSGMPPAGLVAAAAAALLALTLLALAPARRRPWLAVGWLWYLGALVPVIGVLQVGVQAMADRYTYLPLTGAFVALAWGAGEVAGRGRRAAPVAALAVAALLALAAVTRGEVAVWRTGVTLFERAVAVSPGSWMAWTNLGLAQAEAGRTAEAIASYRRSLELGPGQAYTHNDLGRALEEAGDLEGARAAYRRAMAFAPGYALVHNNLGTTYASQGRLDLALPHFEDAVRLDPAHADARYNLARALALLGRRAEAQRHAREALRLSPLDAEARRLLDRLAGSPSR